MLKYFHFVSFVISVPLRVELDKPNGTLAAGWKTEVSSRQSFVTAKKSRRQKQVSASAILDDRSEDYKKTVRLLTTEVEIMAKQS